MVGLALLFVAADQLTKKWALSALATQDLPLVGSFLQLHLIFNPGAAFSFGTSSTWIFTIIAALACIAIPALIYRARGFAPQLALVLIWAGALGNLIDRLFRDPGFGIGHVVDFIQYGTLFVGNVADIELVVGVIWLLILEMRSEHEKASEKIANGEGDPLLVASVDGEIAEENAGGITPNRDPKDSSNSDREELRCEGLA